MPELSPLKAIRKKCLDCCAGSINEVKQCHLEDCTLHPFRFGRRPGGKKRTMTEDQKAASSARLKKMWADKRKGVKK